MPSVRVRRNTATVAQLVPPERLQNSQSTSSNGNTNTQRQATAPVQSSGGSGEDGSNTKSVMQGDAVVQLAPPLAVAAEAGNEGGKSPLRERDGQRMYPLTLPLDRPIR